MDHRSRQDQADRRNAYKAAVVAALADRSPRHARALRERGAPLGWWQAIEFGFLTRRPADSIADSIAADNCPGEGGPPR